MDKIKYMPMALFSIAAAKSLILGGNWSDVAIMVVLSATAAFWEFKETKKRQKEVEDHFKKQDEVILKMSVELASLREQMASVKIAAGLRQTNVGRI